MTNLRHLLFVLVFCIVMMPWASWAAVCDVDDDGDIDRKDILPIALARDQPVRNPLDPRDADGNGVIDIVDLRRCMQDCTLVDCPVIDPPGAVPIIDISPGSIDFGEVMVDAPARRIVSIGNSGEATLEVAQIIASGAPLRIIPPIAFAIPPGGADHQLEIDLRPLTPGSFSGTVTINSNARNLDPVVIAVSGNGVVPEPEGEPDILVVDSLDFGRVGEGGSSERQFTVFNFGYAPLDVSAVTSDSGDFVVSAPPGESLPFTLDPGVSRNLSVLFTAPAGSGGTRLTGVLSVFSNDPDESPRAVGLGADVVPPPDSLK